MNGPMDLCGLSKADAFLDNGSNILLPKPLFSNAYLEQSGIHTTPILQPALEQQRLFLPSRQSVFCWRALAQGLSLIQAIFEL